MDSTMKFVRYGTIIRNRWRSTDPPDPSINTHLDMDYRMTRTGNAKINTQEDDIINRMKRKERYYIDTSVIGGCLDDEFARASKRLMDLFIKGEKTALVSDITIAEISRAPVDVQKVLDEIPSEHIEEVFLDEESNDLSASYIKEKVITARFLADSQHIAIATVVNADVMISWNFKHIVNIEMIRGFNSVNIKLGYGTMEIRSPWEVVGHE